ncbi:uncharacterized protein LOC124156925 [Ischnura elegans]|uniref:uncharacterized protein LOC124156925 n=1 Tax=Ischnura elegans TaxID=197161 RepID=UPI001ED89D77|nr:uncharacterized protein LOC124156925 [Ischnura elegans]
MTVSGLGGKQHVACRAASSITIKPRFPSSFSCKNEVLVVPLVTSYTPGTRYGVNDWSHLKDLVLADPNFAQNAPIELLLGAAVHARVVEGDIIKGKPNQPIATATALGWIISGETNFDYSQSTPTPTVLHSSEMSVDSLLQRFWLQEEINAVSVSLTPEEQACESHFKSTYSRNSDGRYVVRLPILSEKLKQLGDTYHPSMTLLFRMENKFKRDLDFQQSYCKFMQEYLVSGHMQCIPESQVNLKKYVFLPHHGVIKTSSTTTRLRTVFNGSLKTNQGFSLNDCLYAGPNLLPGIASLVSAWRKYRYAFTTDIKMMYRQILVHEADRHLQTILWRFNPLEKVQFFLLCTLTYGLKCSPFIANRVIKQLAKDEAVNFPLGSIILSEETYMDDVLSGGHDIQTALLKQQEVINLCKVGGFPLRKWLSNAPALMEQLPNDLLASEPELLFEDDSDFAVLGLTWQPNEDYFKFSVKIKQYSEPWTKRRVLSAAAKLFDPLGWLAPIVILAKIFLQKLWLIKIGWDEELCQSDADFWQTYYGKLSQVSNIKIPRWLGFSNSNNTLQLHGFADASKSAYAAVLYLRTDSECSGSVFTVKLIQAKTKVSPLRTLSIPRLELCAVHLLAKLINQNRIMFESELLEIHLWTDSQDVLYWLRDHPSRWPTFVANRCSDIHSLVPNVKWHHVGTKFNPADLASRGCSPSTLRDQKLWWSGPSWLSKHEKYWPNSSKFQAKEFLSSELLVGKLTASLTTSVLEKTDALNIFKKYSTLKTLKHVMAYMIRFLSGKKVIHPVFHEAWFKISAIYSEQFLTPSEVNRARLLLVYMVQRQSFAKEISQLEKAGILPKKSALVKLSPFVKERLLRVGGRIKHSLLSDDEKHPLILPSKHPFTELIIEDCHKATLHGGVQLTLTTLRTQYWIVKGRQIVKTIIHRCLNCQRYRATPAYQIMGNLPAHTCRPFSRAGVDYAGPISIRASFGRGQSSYKGFICIFICLSTRAVHLEAVSSYSSESFIAAFRRFVGRRGHCSLLLSDRGTNFIGANQELKRMFQRSSDYNRTIAEALASTGTEWRFNLPAAPHFGGIWEAAVKSTKHHIRRVIGDTKLTFEELSTLLCQVEACLNSRPLIPLTDDPTDNKALTPAHFLIHSASFIIPEPSLIDEIIPVLKRWKIVQQMLQHFWQRWSREYLQSLQQRQKWTHRTSQINIGDLVILRCENTPPAQWPLARIIHVYPGDDGLVRVVKVKFNNSVMIRPLSKLIILNNVSNQSSQ